MPLRIAHRGMSTQARENTLPAFALALDAGADGIELDVHATGDGVVVVHHDPALPDGTPFTARTHDALATYEAAPGVPIPTLRDVCALVGTRATLFVEIKGMGIERRVLDALEGHPGPVAIHSFDHALITRLHETGCPWPLGILVEGDTGDLPALMQATGARDVWPHYPLVSAELVEAVHGRGGRVIAWTVNDAADARHLAALGVDGLCGDDVRIFRTP
jgi:glycerophosphoryl diester phosphodiesterase